MVSCKPPEMTQAEWKSFIEEEFKELLSGARSAIQEATANENSTYSIRVNLVEKAPGFSRLSSDLRWELFDLLCEEVGDEGWNVRGEQILVEGVFYNFGVMRLYKN